MKKSMVFLFGLLVGYCGFAQMSPFELVPQFFKGLSEDNADVVKRLMPTQIWMKDNMVDFKEKSDKEVKESQEGWVMAIQSKFAQLSESYKSRKIDLDKLKIGDVSLKEQDAGKGMTMGFMLMDLSYNDKTIEFGLVGLVTDEGYFLSDIPNSYGVFDKFFE